MLIKLRKLSLIFAVLFLAGTLIVSLAPANVPNFTPPREIDGEEIPDSDQPAIGRDQTASEETAAVADNGADEIRMLEDNCRRLLGELRATLNKAKQAEFGYMLGTYAQSDDFLKMWDEALVEGKKIKRELNLALFQLMMRTDQLDAELADLARTAIGPMFEDYQYEMVYQMATRLDRIFPNERDIQLMRARSALVTNRFDEAAQIRDLIGDLLRKMEDHEREMFLKLPNLQAQMAKEMNLRQVEAEADDLPRVEMVTSEGTFVLELFENQYPQTVGNFISLVEGGFYDNLIFHRVTKNFLPLSLAEAGFLEMQLDLSTGVMRFPRRYPGYNIVDEKPQGELRPHLRGTISMLREYDQQGFVIPNSQSATFFIPLVPIPMLDGQHTVFGRVVSNIEVIDKIQSNINTSPDDGKETPVEQPGFTKIIKATVLRKRDREYVPNPVQ